MNKVLKIAHLNAELLKCRQHFIETKEMISRENFDTLTISEKWFNSKISNTSVEIEGYKVYELDCQRIPFSRITITRGQFDFYS